MKKTLLIGTGAGGNKAVLRVLDLCEITKDDVILVNSTSKDIPDEWDGKRIILSTNDAGCGKERGVAKEMTLTAIQSGMFNIEELVENYDKVVIVASLEGGTGSGSAPILAKYVSQVFGKNTHIIGFKGFEEDPRGLQNTVEFFQDLGDEIVVQCINNKAFLKEAGNSKFKAEQLANNELAKRLRLLDGTDLVASEQNIDSTDLYKVTNTVGYTTVEYAGIRSLLTDKIDFDKLCDRMITYSKSLRSKDAGQQRMAVIMNISPVNEDFVDSSFRIFKEAYGNPYEIFIHKQYVEDLEEFIAVISSGQKMPLDEVKSLYDLYTQESKKVNKSADLFSEEISKLKGLMEDRNFDIGTREKNITKNKEDFFKQFQTKPSAKTK